MSAVSDALHGLNKPGRTLPPALKFVIAGALNTLLSIIVYQLMLFVAGHVVAYAVGYISSIAVAYYLYARHVFDAPMTPGRFAAFAVFYLFTWFAGTLVNTALIEYLGLHARLAIFVTIAIMLPVNYVGSRRCMRAGER